MSDSIIFAVGLITFLLLAGGLGFTVIEMRRISNIVGKKN